MTQRIQVSNFEKRLRIEAFVEESINYVFLAWRVLLASIARLEQKSVRKHFQTIFVLFISELAARIKAFSPLILLFNNIKEDIVDSFFNLCRFVQILNFLGGKKV